jgi:hypothetical protein
MGYINPIFGAAPDRINRQLAFVLMPFKDDLTRIYVSIVKPVVEEIGLDCLRADDYKTARAIIQDIWYAICESRLVIADMTGLNPNVMYELGIAHAVGKNTIIIHQKKQDVQFPFDLAHIRRIEYEDTAEGVKILQRELNKTLRSVLKQQPLTGPIMAKVSETPEPATRTTTSVGGDSTKRFGKTIPVESTQTQNDIKLTLHSVDLKEDATIAYLSVENNSLEEISFFSSYSYAVQGTKQFRCDGLSINAKIPPGIAEEGYAYFQAVDYVQGRIRFNFEILYNRNFMFEIEIPPV